MLKLIAMMAVIAIVKGFETGNNNVSLHMNAVSYKWVEVSFLNSSSEVDNLHALEFTLEEVGLINNSFVGYAPEKSSKTVALLPEPVANDWISRRKVKMIGNAWIDVSPYKSAKDLSMQMERETSKKLRLLTAPVPFAVESLHVSVLKKLNQYEVTCEIRRFRFGVTVDFNNCNLSNEIIVMLTSNGLVLSLELDNDSVSLHNKFLRAIVMEGKTEETKPADAFAYKIGLTGAGQLIGIGDTGVDYNSCFFSDKNAKPPILSWSEAIAIEDLSLSVDSSARKIALYVNYADAMDLQGHGTHLAATIAGEVDSTSSHPELRSYNGIAEQARLVVFDMGAGSSSTLKTPEDIEGGYLRLMYDSGARALCNSWGTESFEYTSMSNAFDNFIYEHPDFVVVVSAGNKGSCGDSGTIVSPANAKNVITVGSSLTSGLGWREEFPDDFDYQKYGQGNNYWNQDSVHSWSSIGPTLDGRIKPDLVAPGVKSFNALSGSSCSVGPLSEKFEDVSVFGTSTSAAIVTAMVAIVREYFMEGFYPSGSRNPKDVFVPSAALMKNILINGAQVLSGVKLVSDEYLGTDSKCQFQGFEDLKIKSSEVFQGFGRAQLDTSLYISGFSKRRLHIPSLNKDFQGSFFDTSLEQGGVVSYRFCAIPDEKQTEIVVTLVWTDPPALASSTIQLVNDLDLIVQYQNQSSSDWIEDLGNWNFYNASAPEGYIGDLGPDRVNNVEIIRLPGPDSEATSLDFRVLVVADRISFGSSQPFTLVVSGNIASGLCSTATAEMKPGNAEPFLYDVPTEAPSGEPVSGTSSEPDSETSSEPVSESSSEPVSSPPLTETTSSSPSEDSIQSNFGTKYLTFGLISVLCAVVVLGCLLLWRRYSINSTSEAVPAPVITDKELKESRVSVVLRPETNSQARGSRRVSNLEAVIDHVQPVMNSVRTSIHKLYGRTSTFSPLETEDRFHEGHQDNSDASAEPEPIKSEL